MDITLLIFTVIGGLAIFVLGMHVMADGLRSAVGNKLRSLLAHTTRRRLSGLALGTTLGTLIHSSAATVMLVGFVNAGLMTLLGSIPLILGANIGTTISMQIISFKLGDYCYVAIAIGSLLQFLGRSTRVRSTGQALLGFGLLFLGMTTMSDAVKPHREALAPILMHINGSTTSGLLTGIAIATCFTAIIQSSGSTIGMCYALISAGVFTELAHVYPIVLGAHIGTCATALLGCVGTNIEARRCALAHLLFNIFNVAIAVFAVSYFMKVIPMTSTDLIHQTANLHTAVMFTGVVIVLPFIRVHAWLTRLISPSRKAPPTPSYLNPDLIERPEMAIYACIRELQRVARICAVNLRLNVDMMLLRFDRKQMQAAKLNEDVINEIKLAMKDYILEIPSRFLSKRQSILIQHIDRCMVDIERIGDHIDAIGDNSRKRLHRPEALVDARSMEWLLDLYQSAARILDLVIASLDPERKDFQAMAESILHARDNYVEKSIHIKSEFSDKVAQREVTPVAGIFYAEYIAALDRIVRHAKSIALVEQKPAFWIKRKKLEKVAGDPPESDQQKTKVSQDYLDMLQREDFL